MTGAAFVVPGGDIAWPKAPPSEGRVFGVRATMLLLTDRGRGFGVLTRFCACERGNFLIVDTGRDTEVVLLGVATGVPTLALMLRLPGAVMESLLDARPNLCGVAGRTLVVPSLVVGLLLDLLELDMAEAGRSGGGMLLSALKKLDLRLPLPPAGDDGTCDKLSMVLSESDGRLFLVAALASGSVSRANSGSTSLPWCPARELAREEALEAERKPSKPPNASSSLLVLGDGLGCSGALVWPEGTRATGFLKTGALGVGSRGWPMLGMPLSRREAEARDVRLEWAGAGAGVEAAAGGTRDSLDVFFCRADTGWGCEGLDIDEMEGFLRSWSVEAGERSWDWLPVDLRTGRRDTGGLGMPEGRGMADWESIAPFPLSNSRGRVVSCSRPTRNACPTRAGASASGQIAAALRAGCTGMPGRGRPVAVAQRNKGSCLFHDCLPLAA